MSFNQKFDFFFFWIRRARSILKEKGLIGSTRWVLERLRHSVSQAHLYVIGHHILRDNPILATETDLEIKQMTVHDNDDIDELIAIIDEWQISKSDTLKMLEKGQLCYVAKYQGHVVACTCVVIEGEFEEYYLRRKLRLAPDEAYYWRTMTLPSFRGRGVVPYLSAQADSDLAHRFGKTFGLGWVKTNNKSMLRALSKIGRMRVGRMGFFQVMNIRFHYLWGRHALKQTKPRFKIQIIW